MDRKWWTLVAVCTATFMLLLDITVVNVALPAIERDLDADFADLQWVVDAYALTLAALLLTAGSLADRIGRRRIFLVGLVVFTAASVLCGLATSPLTLNLARSLQGVGGAFMFATSLALLASAYSGRDRGTALGLWGATTGAAVAVGPLVGGVLTEGIGWEAIFFVNVPIGIVAVALTLARVEESKNPHPGRLDWPGTVLFSGALFLLIFGLIRGNPEGWSSAPIVASLSGAGVLLVGFVLVERSREDAMLDLGLFRVPSFVGASVAAFVLSAAMFAMFLYLTLYIQNILGYSALESGIRFMPVTLLSFVVAPISGKLAERVGVRWFIAGGLALVGAGRASSSPEAASAWSTLRSPRRRSGSSTRAARGWRRASTRPSGRSASPPGSPHGARSSSTSCATSSCATPRPRACAAFSSAAARSPTSSHSAARAAAATRSSRGSASRPSSQVSTTCCCSPVCSRSPGRW
jgi:EmrB/QacA subfamily drug resistance transporter